MRGPLVKLVDDALEPKAFKRLQKAIVGLGRERIVAGYQTTFWFDFQEPPSNLVEQAALAVREHIPARLRQTVIGVEWWLSRMRTSNVKVDFHRDRDNARWDERREERNPRFSSLIYLNECRGGLLAVTEHQPNPKNPAFAPDELEFDFVEPRPNRFAFFDGTLTHGVLDARNQVPGARLPTERTWRQAIAVNFWPEHPWGVPRYADSPHYRALALRPSRGLDR